MGMKGQSDRHLSQRPVGNRGMMLARAASRQGNSPCWRRRDKSHEEKESKDVFDEVLEVIWTGCGIGKVVC